MQAYLSMLKNYVNFRDRPARRPFWTALLIHAAVLLALMLFGILVPVGFFEFFSGWYMLATFLPVFCMALRRLSDSGRSQWLILFFFLPVIGMIVLAVLCAQPSAPADGRPLV